MTELQVIKKQYDSILRRLDEIGKPKPIWVSAADLMKVTGRDKYTLAPEIDHSVRLILDSKGVKIKRKK
jgi:hypothetical protein